MQKDFAQSIQLILSFMWQSYSFLSKQPRVPTIFLTFAVDMAILRIEYIDAVQGFTMTLVVLAHVCIFISWVSALALS